MLLFYAIALLILSAFTSVRVIVLTNRNRWLQSRVLAHHARAKNNSLRLFGLHMKLVEMRIGYWRQGVPVAGQFQFFGE